MFSVCFLMNPCNKMKCVLVQQNVSIKPMDYDQTFMEFYVIVVVSIHSCIIFACVSFVAGKLVTFMEMSDIGKNLFWG